MDGAYQLGRGEARSGRSVDALLSAYRIGARVAWREMSAAAVRNDVDAGTLARFAELVFAYIDELSASSVAGHNDELANSGRVRHRLLERLAAHLLDGSTPEVVESAAERADWIAPETLTAVIVPESQVRTVFNAIGGETLQSTEEHRGHGAAARPGRPRAQAIDAAQGARRTRCGRRSGTPLAGGAFVLRTGAARAGARASAPTARSTSPSWC